jgi:hypothetical protein
MSKKMIEGKKMTKDRDMNQLLLAGQDDEKKEAEVKLTIKIKFRPGSEPLRRLNMLLSDNKFEDAKWPDAHLFWRARVIVKEYISFLCGDSVISFGFSCRAFYNFSSQYLKADLEKLKRYQFERPLFSTHDMLRHMKNINIDTVPRVSQLLNRKSEKLQKIGNKISTGGCVVSFGGIVGGAVWLAFGLGVDNNATEVTAAWGAMVGFAGLCILTCAGDRVRVQCVRRLKQSEDTEIQRIQSDFFKLESSLEKWQNEGNYSLSGARTVLRDRSCSPSS